jgi:hypothetical protein
MSKKVSTLYHYCSLETFYNIMKNRSIWLSDVSKSNDSKELAWATEQCKKAVIKKFLEYSDRMKSNNDFIHTRFRDFNRITDQFDSIDTKQTLKSWVFCLSEKGDNLGQWRGYADDGKGVAIGFAKEYFASQNQSVDFEEDKMYYMFDRIEYGDFKVEQLLNPCDINILASSCDYEALERCIKRLMAYSIILAPLYKSATFEEEKEWRMVFLANTNALKRGMIPSANYMDKPELMFDIIDFAFVPKNNTLVSHIEVALKDIKRAITSVTIGPKSDLSVLDIQLFLISIGLLQSTDDDSIKVTRSSASYR